MHSYGSLCCCPLQKFVVGVYMITANMAIILELTDVGPPSDLGLPKSF